MAQSKKSTSKRTAPKRPTSKRPTTKRSTSKPATAAKTSKTPKQTAKRPAKQRVIVATPSSTPTPPISSTTPQRILDYLHRPLAGQLFVGFSLVVLAATTLLWSILSARLQQANADQLIDTYLFESGSTYSAATFPGAHSFLLKWPLFAAMHIFGTSSATFIGMTVAIVLLTLTVLVYILRKIERRPVVFGLLCLALASILLLIPAQPYPGALLPVNMAMLTTRNLEYAAFLLVLYGAAKLPRLRSWRTVALLTGLAIIIASDKLFAVLAIGGGLFAALWTLWRFRRRTLIIMYWPAIAIASLAGATVLLWLLDRAGITGIGSGGSTSPFPLISSVRQFGIGVIFGLGALLTNFGANPVHGVTIIRDIPAALGVSLGQLSIISYIVNFGSMAAGLFAMTMVVIRRPVQDGALHLQRLVVLLVGSSLSAAAVYVITDHYYPVDARYLTIVLFTAIVAAAVYLRGKRIAPSYLLAVSTVLLVSLPFGIMQTVHEYQASQTALSGRNSVSSRVSDELQRHKINRLFGNYWDITPVKGMQSAGSRPLTIVPVDHCNLPRQILSSSIWFTRGSTVATAYLAVKDGSASAGPDSVKIPNVVTYGGCSLAHIVSLYGVPAERVDIDQSSLTPTKPSAPSPVVSDPASDMPATIPEKSIEPTPDVLLLLYPKGVTTIAATPVPAKTTPKPSPHRHILQAPTIRSYTALGENDTCPEGTIMQVVAHQDDDLLFMNPDVQTAIQAHKCIRTIYMTAGDAGEDYGYWGSREQGAKAAYAQMYNVANSWYDESQDLNGHAVMVSYLNDAPQVSLVFMRLPDGNMGGTGFPGHKYQSLSRLLDGSIPSIESVDQNARYSLDQLEDSLRVAMSVDQPSEIRSQASSDAYDGDHSDHHAVGLVTDTAALRYQSTLSVMHYLGYPDKLLPVNLLIDEAAGKQATFLTYAKYDGAVCQTAYECDQSYTYGNYLLRKYQP